MTTTFLVASTPAEVLTMAAAVRSGALDGGARRVLVVEGSVDARSAAARRVAEQLALVDAVVGVEALLARSGDAEPDLVELVVGTASLRAGRALARHLAVVPVTLVAAGSAAYGPTPEGLRGRLVRLTTRVVHLDLVAGLVPLLLAERGVATTAVALEHHRAAVAALPAPELPGGPTTLVLGRQGDWVGALGTEEQAELLVAMVQRCAEAGHSRIVLLADGDTRPRTRRALEKAAAGARADLTVVDEDGPAEPWLAVDAVRLVVGSASDDLLVASAVFGRRTGQLDSDVVLRHLDPFSDPRRTAATLVAATVPDLRSWTVAPEGEPPPRIDLQGLTTAVGYAMRPDLLPGRRREAIELLGSSEPARRLVRRRRLSELRLPGGKRRVRKTLD